MLDQANEVAKNVFEFFFTYMPLWMLSAMILGLILVTIASIKEVLRRKK